jgi:prevent-host-death family protein
VSLVAIRNVPLSEAKAKLSQLVDDLADRDEHVTITRHGRPVAMLVKPDAFESLEATIDIMRDPVFYAEVLEAIKQANDPNTRWYTEEQMNAIFDELDAAEAEGRQPAPSPKPAGHL